MRSCRLLYTVVMAMALVLSLTPATKPARAMAEEDTSAVSPAVSPAETQDVEQQDATDATTEQPVPDAESDDTESAVAAPTTDTEASPDEPVQDETAAYPPSVGEEDAASSEETGVVADTPVLVTVRFEGDDGEWGAFEGLQVSTGASAWEATCLALAQSGLSYGTGTPSADDVLVSLANPLTGEELALDTASGNAWHLYVNGERYQGAASTYIVSEGDKLAWRYEFATINVSVCVVGPGGTDAAFWIEPTSVSVSAGQSVWDASYIAFEQWGYTQGRQLYYELDETGAVELGSLSTLSENGITGETWRLFVNGVPAEQDAAHVTVHAGDSICWYYVGHGVSELPDFVAKTGAASQSPLADVRVDGAVREAWSEPNANSLRSVLDSATGMRTSGYSCRAALLSADAASISPFSQMACGDSWSRSLPHLLDARITTGEGGRAASGLDGALYYLNELGSVVKLEVR